MFDNLKVQYHQRSTVPLIIPWCVTNANLRPLCVSRRNLTSENGTHEYFLTPQVRKCFDYLKHIPFP